MGAKRRKSSPAADGFGARLRELRVARRLSQEDLGQLADLHYTHVGRYEREEAQPSAAKLSALANALGVSSDYLLNGSHEDYARASFEDEELLRLFQRANELTPENKEMLKRFVRLLFNDQKLDELAASKSG
jgi:transcriptional regulator with XRE-family HTH domain